MTKRAYTPGSLVMMNRSTSTDDRHRHVDKSVYLVIECLGPGHVGYHSEVVVRPDGRWEINKYPIPISDEFENQRSTSTATRYPDERS